MEDGQRSYWDFIEPVWDQIDIYNGAEAFIDTYKGAGFPAGQLYAAHFAQSEICNGGFKQLFQNSTGVLAPEAEEGFRLIGMSQLAEAVAAAIKLFGENYPRNRQERQKAMAGIQLESFNWLDKAFYSLVENENGGFVVAANTFVSKIEAK